MANYPARSSGDQTINYLRAPITPGVGLTGVVQVGTLPAGCVVVRASIVVATAFNFGTLSQGSLGIVGSAAAYATTVTISTAGVIAAGTNLATAVAAATAPSVDTQVIFTSTSTGTLATAGVAYVVVEYAPVA